MVEVIIYLHGFNSAPSSTKATQLKQAMEQHGLGQLYVCPALPSRPLEAIMLIEKNIAKSKTPVTLIGSSLGGYYATYLTEKHQLKAVLVNPAVNANISLQPCLGKQKNYYTDEEYEFTEAHLDELQRLEVKSIRKPERYLLMVETGDELLDYREAVEKFKEAKQIVIQGGDHSFQHFTDYIETIIEFSGLN